MSSTSLDIQLLTGSKFPTSTHIAGKYYKDYDRVLYPVLINIIDIQPYISILYPYVFTGNHNLSWQMRTDINKHIQLDYNPNLPTTFYLYHEIYKKYLEPQNHNFKSVLVVGLDHGFIECLAYHDKITPATHIHFIGTEKSNEAYKKYIHDTHKLKKHKHLEINAGLNNTLYNVLLDTDDIKTDILVFNYYIFMLGVNYNFAFQQIFTNFIGMMLALKTLVKGGTFIMHMYAIINKSSADVFLILSKYFKTADLYFPESSNEYKATGTWAIFTGFKGIDAQAMDKLYDVLEQVKQIYPRGLLDVNIYDERIRKKCIAYKKIDESLPHDYILGYLPEYNDTDSIYNKIVAFNNKTYARKYEFTSAAYELYKSKKYPNIYYLPTYEQSQASVKYLKKWGFSFTINNVLGTEPKQNTIIGRKIPVNEKHTYLLKSHYLDTNMMEYELEKRGNWIKYDPAKHKQIDFFYIDGVNISDRRLFKVKSVLKSLVGDVKKAVTIKSNLYDNLSKIPGTSKFLPWTLPFDIKGKSLEYLYTFEKYFAAGKPLICKVVNEGRGQNIINTDNFQEFFNFMKGHYDTLKNNSESTKNKWVLQEYIANPYLIDGKKFHIRTMLVYQPGNLPSYYMYHSRIALAKLPYVKGDWMNKDIHDTHFHKTPGLNWPADFSYTNKELKHIYDQTDFICSSIVSCIPPGCYPNSKHCFETFGIDLMITDNLTIKLIEVNEKIDISATDLMKKKFFNGILNLVVDEYFPPLNTQPIQGNFFKINKLNKRTGKTLSNAKTKKLRNNKIKHWINFYDV